MNKVLKGAGCISVVAAWSQYMHMNDRLTHGHQCHIMLISTNLEQSAITEFEKLCTSVTSLYLTT
jgi:hypothetical protein